LKSETIDSTNKEKRVRSFKYFQPSGGPPSTLLLEVLTLTEELKQDLVQIKETISEKQLLEML